MGDGLALGTGPVSFGVDFADEPGNPRWSEVLDGIAAAGYRWTELGPIGYLPEDAGPALAARGLGLTAGFVFEPLHDPARRADTVVIARAVAERVAALGGEFTARPVPPDGWQVRAELERVT
jgi:inosose dehydratase